MQINKVNSTPNFGAKLNLTDVAKKHWNMSDKEIKELCSKAEEIGTAQDTITINIRKCGELSNSEMLIRNNAENQVAGSFRQMTADMSIAGRHPIYEFTEYIDEYSEKLKKPFNMIKQFLNSLTRYYPNEVHAQRKEQSLKALNDAQSKNL